MHWELLKKDHTFIGVDGDIHAFRGCSAAGVFQFEATLKELAQVLQADPNNSPPQSLYRTDPRFRWLIEKALALNGISAYWVNWDQIEQLLFGKPGEIAVLTQVNRSTNPPAKTDKPTTLAEIVALLAGPEGDYETALTLVTELPAPFLSEVLAARSTLFKSPEEQANQSFDDWAEQKRKQAAGENNG